MKKVSKMSDTPLAETAHKNVSTPTMRGYRERGPSEQRRDFQYGCRAAR